MSGDRHPEGAGDKRARRLARKEEQQRARSAAQRRRRVVRGGAWVAAIGLVLVGGWALFGPDPELDGVDRPPNQGREHVAQGTPIDYDHPAPTSGPHWPAAPQCRIYTEPLGLELAVHALEHGVVVVWHDPDLAEDQLSEIRQAASAWDSHVIVSPNPDIQAPVVATAWDRRMDLDGPGETLEEFIDVYRRRGPERVDCPQVR